jgi:uncharacterized protein (TIGR02270 family)
MFEHIIEQHVDDAAFLWELRDRAAGSLGYRRTDLAALDTRVEAHLDALRVAGEPAWELLWERYRLDDAGEQFAAAQLALEARAWGRFAQVLNRVGSAGQVPRGVISALGWTPWETIADGAHAMCDRANPPELVALGVAAHAAHGRDPGGALDHGVRASSAVLRLRSLRAAASLGRDDLAQVVVASLAADDAAERYWAAWAGALLGRRECWRPLWDAAGADEVLAARARALAIRVAPAREAAGLLAALAAQPTRSHVRAAAIAGDGAALPWLLELLDDPGSSRLAAWAIAAITGVDLAAEQCVGSAPPGFHSGPSDDPDDEVVAMDPDDDLEWPDAAALRARCAGHRERWPAGNLFLAGRPRSEAALREILGRGSQFERWCAALELCLASPSAPLVETRFPAYRGDA